MEKTEEAVLSGFENISSNKKLTGPQIFILQS